MDSKLPEGHINISQIILFDVVPAPHVCFPTCSPQGVASVRAGEVCLRARDHECPHAFVGFTVSTIDSVCVVFITVTSCERE